MEQNICMEQAQDATAACDDDPVAVFAKTRFGIEYVFPLQRLVIANILDAVSPDTTQDREVLRQLVLLPTGFGKSLCFQLPALCAPEPTLVVYPLLALMADQKRTLDSCGVACAIFRGGMDHDEKIVQELLVTSGRAKIIITNPEMLQTAPMRRFLSSLKISHFVIDEAHCVSEWGDSFRPSYLALGEIISLLNPPAVSAFTATASPYVADMIAQRLFGECAYKSITVPPDRPNIHFSIAPTLEKSHTLLRLVSTMEKPLVVFCASREGSKILAELIAARLRLDTRFYHAGLSRAEKTAIEKWFLPSNDGILCATCAYGMGVDKKNIRSVIHYEAPSSVEAYLQEAGRAGRDGQLSRAVLMYLDNKNDAANPPGQDALSLLTAARKKLFISYAKATSCRRKFLLHLMGSSLERPCTGCDICDSTALLLPEGAQEILAFVQANARRFTRQEAAVLLRREMPHMEPPRCAGSGAMASWETTELRNAILMALQSGFIHETNTLFWKEKLAPGVAKPAPLTSGFTKKWGTLKNNLPIFAKQDPHHPVL